MKNTRLKQIIVVLFLTTLFLGLTGVTFSYFQNTGTMTNEFQAGDYSTSVTETFTSPLDWKPGDETSKTLDIKNEGDIPMAVRVSYTESWKDSNNQDLPITTNGVKTTIINLDNTDDWRVSGNYIFYNGPLDAGETASSPIKSVTFNKDIVDDPVCTTTNGVTNCTNTFNGYEDATYTLTFTIETVQYNMLAEAWPEATLYYVLKNEYDSGSGYAGLYTGQHQDSITRAASKNIYYFTTATENDVTQGNNLLDKMNVLFGGFCWQMLRTTDTGGVKMIYNGIPVDGKCENTRSNVNGLKQSIRTTENMDGSYAYGSVFTYDLTNQTFKLDGTIKENTNYISDNTVIGMYTCKEVDKDETCSTLYYIDEDNPEASDEPFVYLITIISINYGIIGISPINSPNHSLSAAGYMYNKIYDKIIKEANTINKYGSSATWNGTSYTLNNVLEITSGSNPSVDQLINHHYFCENNTTQCSNVEFIISYSTSTNKLSYVELSNGLEKGIDALNEMLYANDVNTNDSTIKRFIDEWYYNNLLEYDDYLEETIYCNNRSLLRLGFWADDGEFIAPYFKEWTLTSDLSCTNETDQFSILNNKAKLKYKIGFPISPEMNLLNNNIVRSTGALYHLVSPSAATAAGAIANRSVTSGGVITNRTVSLNDSVRPVISLLPSTVPISGTGTMENPYIIDIN